MWWHLEQELSCPSTKMRSSTGDRIKIRRLSQKAFLRACRWKNAYRQSNAAECRITKRTCKKCRIITHKGSKHMTKRNYKKVHTVHNQPVLFRAGSRNNKARWGSEAPFRHGVWNAAFRWTRLRRAPQKGRGQNIHRDEWGVKVKPPGCDFGGLCAAFWEKLWAVFFVVP
mgnify:CR=1 FL=1